MAETVERYRIVGENQTGAAFRAILRDSKSTADRVAASFRNAFGAVSVIAAGRTLLNWNKQAIEQADTLGTLAQSFNVSVEAMSRFDYVARQSNTTLEQLVPGLTSFQKNLVLAGENSGRARKALAELNLDADKLSRLPLPEQLVSVSEAFRRIEGPADRVRIAAQLFGDDVGRRMIPILLRGRDGLRELGEEADRTGATLTKEMAEKLQAMDAEMKRVQAQAELLKRELALGLGPAVLELGKVFNTTAQGVLHFGEVLARALHGADDPVLRLQDQLAELQARRAELLNSINQAQAHEAGAKLIDQLRADLRGVETDMNRVNAALLQFGRDAQAYEAFEPVIAGAARAAGAVEHLRDAIKDIRESGQLNQELPTFGGSDEENTRVINERLEEVRRTVLNLGDRTLEVEGNFLKTSDAAKSLMETLKDEGARRAVGYISDAIMNLDDGARGFAKGMIDAFRRILADHAAQQIMAWFSGLGKGGGSGSGGGGFLGGLGRFFGNLFGGGSRGGLNLPPGSTPTVPGFAAGGFMPPGSLGVVGERGPELAMAGSRGATIIPFDRARAGGNVYVTVNAPTTVDARGATRDSVDDLMRQFPAIMDERDARLESKIITGIKRRQYDLG